MLTDSLKVGTGTAVGTAVGSVVPGVGNILGAGLGSIFDSIFGSVDKGQWVGNSFIPGDLANRQNWVRNRITQRGLSQNDVDQNRIYKILTSEGDWNAAIDTYLQRIIDLKTMTSALNKEEIENVEISPNNPSGSIPPSLSQTVQQSLSNLDLKTILLFGAGAFLVFKLIKA